MINILQGSVVSQTMLRGLTIHPPVAISYSVPVPKIMKIKLLQFATISRLTFLAHPVYTHPHAVQLIITETRLHSKMVYRQSVSQVVTGPAPV